MNEGEIRNGASRAMGFVAVPYDASPGADLGLCGRL
jgi:hypothetical protein